MNHPQWYGWFIFCGCRKRLRKHLRWSRQHRHHIINVANVADVTSLHIALRTHSAHNAFQEQLCSWRKLILFPKERFSGFGLAVFEKVRNFAALLGPGMEMPWNTVWIRNSTRCCKFPSPCGLSAPRDAQSKTHDVTGNHPPGRRAFTEQVRRPAHEQSLFAPAGPRAYVTSFFRPSYNLRNELEPAP